MKFLQAIVVLLIFWVIWIIGWKIVFAALDMTYFQIIIGIGISILIAAAIGKYRQKKKLE